MPPKHKSKKELRQEAAKKRAGSMGESGSDEGSEGGEGKAHHHHHGDGSKEDDSNIWCGVEGLQCTIM